MNSTVSLTINANKTWWGSSGLDDASQYLIGARYYDPELGVWISQDPRYQFANPYGYGGKGTNPIRYYDRDGRFLLELIMIGVTLYGMYEGGRAVNKGQEDPTKWDFGDFDTWKGMIVGGASGLGLFNPYTFIPSAISLYNAHKMANDKSYNPKAQPTNPYNQNEGINFNQFPFGGPEITSPTYDNSKFPAPADPIELGPRYDQWGNPIDYGDGSVYKLGPIIPIWDPMWWKEQKAERQIAVYLLSQVIGTYTPPGFWNYFWGVMPIDINPDEAGEGSENPITPPDQRPEIFPMPNNNKNNDNPELKPIIYNNKQEF